MSEVARVGRRLALELIVVGTLSVAVYGSQVEALMKGQKEERAYQLEEQCRRLGRRIQAHLPAEAGFVLMFYDREEPGSLAYVSDGPREDAIMALRRLIERLERERS